MSQKESEELRVPMLELALVNEEKKKDRPSRKKTEEVGNKNHDGDNRVPQEKKTMNQNQTQTQTQGTLPPDMQQMLHMMMMHNPGLLKQWQEKMGLNVAPANGEDPISRYIQEAPASLRHAVFARACGLDVQYAPVPSGWETAGAAFGVGAGLVGGGLAAVGIAVAAKIAFDAFFGPAPTTTG